jgi:hypothetical protein
MLGRFWTATTGAFVNFPFPSLLHPFANAANFNCLFSDEVLPRTWHALESFSYSTLINHFDSFLRSFTFLFPVLFRLWRMCYVVDIFGEMFDFVMALPNGPWFQGNLQVTWSHFGYWYH